MLRVGVIGVGNMGLNHARVYAELEGVKLCAVADADAARANTVATRFNTNAYTNYREMLVRENLEAVTIAVPTREHFQVASDVIRAGINLLIEKPLAANVAEAQALVDAAQNAKLVLAVGHIERFNPAVRELKHLIDANALGNISTVIARRVGIMPPQVQDANVVIDLAVHDIDVLNYLFGELPTLVSATAGYALLEKRFDHAEIFLRYKNAGCFVQVNWITPLKIRTLSVTGDAGHAELNYVTQKLELFESTRAREFDTFGDFVVRFGEPRRTQIQVQMCEPLHLELENFIHAIRHRTPLHVTAHEGLRALQIAQAALQSLNANSTLQCER